MKRTIWLRHDSHVRANHVCTQHADTYDVNPGAKKARLALNDYVNESSRLMAAQARAIEDRKAATEQCRLCRRALRAAGYAVVKVGKLVNLPDTVMHSLSIPGSISDGGLIAHMQGLHDRVLPYQAAFEGEGLPPDVLTSLANGIKALEAARAARAATLQDAASAEEALHENQRLASATILALESVVPTTTPGNRELVTRLKVARRVGPRKAQPAAAASNTASTTSSTPPGTTSPAVPPSPTPAPAPAKEKVS